MKRFAGLMVLSVVWGGAALAAEVTRVASSGDPDHAFGFFIDVAYNYRLEHGKLTREHYQSNTSVDVDELQFQNVRHELDLDAYIGLYQDLQFHFGVPIVFADDKKWVFSKDTDSANTTLYRNCAQTDGTNYPGCSPGAADASDPRSRLFEVNDKTRSFRSGLGNLTFGLAYAIFSQARDDTKPTWLVSFDYVAPTATAMNPTVGTTAQTRGPLGDKVHHYNFSTAISKRVSFLDPYFKLWYSMPFLGPGYYSNCDDADASRLGRPENCGISGWTRTSTGVQPPHTGGFQFGTEVIVFENPGMHQKVAFDVRGNVAYTSEGRYYNQMSDLFGKLLYNQDFLELGGQIGFTGHAAEYVRLSGFVSLSYNTEHFITREAPGEDFNKNGSIDPVGSPDEINPNYDWRIDHPGRRFRIVEDTVFRAFVTATFAF